MKKKPIILIAVGVFVLAAGAFMRFHGGASMANSALVKACQENMKQRGVDASLIARCDQTAFATAMTATDANAAARAISGANHSERQGNSLSLFLLGFGLILTISGVVLGARPRV